MGPDYIPLAIIATIIIVVFILSILELKNKNLRVARWIARLKEIFGIAAGSV